MKCNVTTTLLHTVERGESIGVIAKAHSMTARDIIYINRMDRPHMIRVGDKIKVQHCR